MSFSFLIAPTTVEAFKYGAGVGFALNMLGTRGELCSSVGTVVIQAVALAASTAFAALTATYGTMTAVGAIAGVGFTAGAIVYLSFSEISVGEGADKRKLSLQEAGVVGVIAVVAVVFGGRVINNALGLAGKFVAIAAQPYVSKGVNYAWPHVQPFVNRAQPYVEQGVAFVRARTGI